MLIKSYDNVNKNSSTFKSSDNVTIIFLNNDSSKNTVKDTVEKQLTI